MPRPRLAPLAAALLLLPVLLPASSTLQAQTLDLGRGEVPITVPESYDAASPAPLIVLLHGYTATGPGQDRYMGFSAIADDYGFLFVAPTGTREAEGNQSTFWNASEACCNFQGSQVDDVGYLKSIIDEVSSRYSIDPLRIHLVGHSNGGFMAYRMAYEHPDLIAGIASLAGASHSGRRPAPGSPVHVLQIHGTDDETISYQGGTLGETRYPGARASVGTWAAYNGCAQPGQARELRDLDATLPGHETGVLAYEAGCAPGGSVALWTISGGSHGPPFSDSFAEQVVEWLLARPKVATGG